MCIAYAALTVSFSWTVSSLCQLLDASRYGASVCLGHAYLLHSAPVALSTLARVAQHSFKLPAVYLQMPNLKKLRTRVQGLRVDSADDRHRDSSPAAADNIGGIMPTYGSPRVEQTMRSYPDLDCGSAKAFNAGAAATKPSGLSRFAPAAGCPVSPTVPATGGCAVQSSKHQHQAIGAQDDSMAGLGGAAASRAESQSAEAPGSVDLPCDDQWVSPQVITGPSSLQCIKQT